MKGVRIEKITFRKGFVKGVPTTVSVSLLTADIVYVPGCAPLSISRMSPGRTPSKLKSSPGEITWLVDTLSVSLDPRLMAPAPFASPDHRAHSRVLPPLPDL